MPILAIIRIGPWSMAELDVNRGVNFRGDGDRVSRERGIMFSVPAVWKNHVGCRNGMIYGRWASFHRNLINDRGDDSKLGRLIRAYRRSLTIL